MLFNLRIQGRRRRGAIAVLAAVFLVLVLAMIAFAVDLGYMSNVKAELQATADAAALAGAGTIEDGVDKAQKAARQFAVFNGGNSRRKVSQHVEVEIGDWDKASKRFLRVSKNGSAVRVTVRRQDEPFFFAPVFGKNKFKLEASAIASATAAGDFMVVLGATQSMNDDSELKSIGKLERTAIENNLAQIYRELGSPKFGTMKWTPDWITVQGKPSSGASTPQISVTFKAKSVDITSSKDLSNVVLDFEGGGQHQKTEGLTGLTGTFSGTGINAGKRITKVWVKSGSNKGGDGPGYGEMFQDNVPTIRRALGLDKVRYPYQSGSWDDYIQYVKTSPTIRDAGYQDKYGYLTWVNYLLEKKPASNETADLWRTSSQPMLMAKEAASIFLKEVRELDHPDRTGLTVFNYSSGINRLESPLVADFSHVDALIRERQAGHYSSPANLGTAIQEARRELLSKGRSSAAKTIVLISDGRTDQPLDANQASKHALAQADASAAAGVRIITLAVGTQANSELMRQIAVRGKGLSFTVSSLSGFEKQLADALKKFSPNPPPRLVF